MEGKYFYDFLEAQPQGCHDALEAVNEHPISELIIKDAERFPVEIESLGEYTTHHLVETRIPFDLEIVELDNVVRGAKDVDLASLEQAAQDVALFEESVVCHGLTEANIKG